MSKMHLPDTEQELVARIAKLVAAVDSPDNWGMVDTSLARRFVAWCYVEQFHDLSTKDLVDLVADGNMPKCTCTKDVDDWLQGEKEYWLEAEPAAGPIMQLRALDARIRAFLGIKE